MKGGYDKGLSVRLHLHQIARENVEHIKTDDGFGLCVTWSWTMVQGRRIGSPSQRC